MGFQQLGITSLLISCSSKNADRGAFKLQGASKQNSSTGVNLLSRGKMPLLFMP